MNIALCDDDKIFLDSLKQRLVKYNCSIFSYQTLQDLINTDITFDIAFLDIELDNNTTGFEIIQFLRMRNKKCIIAFFTNYTQYAIKGYEYQAFRYILKTEPDYLISERINDVFKEYYRRNKTISGSYNGYTFSTQLDDIYYISISNHILTLHTLKGNFEVYRQMKDLNEELNELDFVRCHRSYMVNLKHILVMRSDYFFVLDDPGHTTIPIGIRYREFAENKYLNSVSIGGVFV